MKNTLITRWMRLGLMTITALAIMVGIVSQAYASNSQIHADRTCVVNRSEWAWTVNASNTLTLRQALVLARDHQGCEAGITLDTDVTAEGPMELNNVGGMPFDGAGHKIDFALWEGNDSSCAITVKSSNINFTNLIVENVGTFGMYDEEIPAEGDVETLPADTTGGASSPTPDPTGVKVKGFCVYGMDNSFDNVDLTAVAGDGFWFADTAANNKIESNSSATNIGGYGIRDNNNSMASFNMIHPIDVDLSAAVLDDNSNYIIQGFDAATKFKVDSSIQGGLMSSAKDVALKVTYIELYGDPTDGEFQIYGALVKGAQDGKIECTTSLSVEPSLARIAIFGYNSTTGEIEFKGMVGQGYSLGVLRDTQSGWFHINIDKSSSSQQQQFRNLNYIILVPMGLEDEIIGKSSSLIRLGASPENDCTSGAGVTPDGTGGDDFTGTGVNSAWTHYSREDKCAEYWGGRTGRPGDTWDSDHDGIFDYIEMGIARVNEVNSAGENVVRWVYTPTKTTCYCDDTLSCWHFADSDHDGVADPYEIGRANSEKLQALKRIDCQTTIDADGVVTPAPAGTTSCPQGIYRYRGSQITDQAWDVTALVFDSNRKPTYKIDPDVKDPDSDSDALEDGIENRNRTFRSEVKAYFYVLNGTNNMPYLNSQQKPVECNLSDPRWGMDITGSGQETPRMVGNVYGLFIAGGEYGNKVDQPILFEAGTLYTQASLSGLPNGAELMTLACRNGTVSGPDNFDYPPDDATQVDKGESNPRKADSDGDCVCDGAGDGCKVLDDPVDPNGNPQAQGCFATHGSQYNIEDKKELWYLDNCPNTFFETRNCIRECIANETLLNLAYNPMVGEEYMDIVYDDATTKAVIISAEFKKDEDGPLLFRKMQQIESKPLPDGSTIKEEIPDYQFIMDVCGDVDDDGIPNCVERWTEFTCAGAEMDRNWLNPYNPDSDSDGLIDGSKGCKVLEGVNSEDVCPFDPETVEGGDQFTETNPQYSCQPYQMYTGAKAGGQPILAYYMDRDCDDIVDGLEDKDLDGRPEKITNKGDQMAIFRSIYTTDTDPLMRDTDLDGLLDKFESTGWPKPTNPADQDTDGDGLFDLPEDADCVGCSPAEHMITIPAMVATDNCENITHKDTDPTNPDTDGDGLTDGLELSGNNVYGQEWYARVASMGMAEFLQSEYADVMSDPTSPDSDNDGICDGPGGTGCEALGLITTPGEYNGVLAFNSSHPCMKDSDLDGLQDYNSVTGDKDECPLNPSNFCQKGDAADGADSDSDGLSDDAELRYGTDPNDVDSDNDGIWDDDEDSNLNGIYERNLGESNATVGDTDSDGLNDGYEQKLGTDPTNPDTDGDCIPDGPSYVTLPDGTQIWSKGEDSNMNGVRDSTETDAMSSDSDGDMLPDGFLNGLGEDRDCDGTVDLDAEGRPTETNPRMPDSDLDGMLDYDEMFDGGFFSVNNIDQATTGDGGCTMVPQATGSASGVIAMMLGLVPAVLVRVRKVLRSR